MKRRPNSKVLKIAILAIFLMVVPATRASDEADVRGMVQAIFQQLKARDYTALYESLPSTSRSRMTRDTFTNALKKAQDMYVLERMNVGPVRVVNDLAVVDTVIYGRLVIPFESEGKIVVQQYLVREDGKWRVATGNRGIIKRFLASNPSFARRFPLREPRIYVKQKGNWVEFRPGRS
ncbi:MAG TPA: hypothetical protein VJ124_06730 [Pyrinomonadaceae bacterium]|nr:hypothetical protein [Pyrinomonadaceae bacterium]